MMEKKALQEIVGRVCPDTINYTGNKYVSDGILDSVEIMEIVTEIEQQFHVVIEPQYIVSDYFESIDTLEKLIQDIRKR